MTYFYNLLNINHITFYMNCTFCSAHALRRQAKVYFQQSFP
jgi:hypothetical protein